MPSSTSNNSIYHTVANGLQGTNIEILGPEHEKYPETIVRWSEAAEKKAVSRFVKARIITLTAEKVGSGSSNQQRRSLTDCEITT